MSFCKISLKIWMKTTILFLFHKISFKAVLRDLLSKLERKQHVFSQDLLWYIGVWEQLSKERNPWVFANYLEDFCHRLKLKTSLKRGWIFICLGSKFIKNGNVKGWFSNDSWKCWWHDCFGLVFSLALRNGG